MKHNKHSGIISEIAYDFDTELTKVLVLTFRWIFTLLNIA